MKGDLDKDGVMSEYEQARQDAIDANMREQKALGGVVGKIASLLSRRSKLEKELMTENMSKANQNKTSKEIESLDEQVKELKKEIDKEPKQEGGLLQDDREQYVVGGLSKIFSKGISKVLKPNKVKQEINNVEKFLLDNKYPEADIFTKQELNKHKKEIGSDLEYLDFLTEFRAIKEADIDYIKRAKKNGMSSAEIKNVLENLERNPKQEGGSIDDQMMMVMNVEPMESDDEMENNYLDFVIDEALSEEEEDMLMSKLEQDEQLSMLFDKVLEVASEFAGSGPVDGPGTGVSDSIPARLSDGEFVFTAKATEEIGADELMRMMKDAEANADKRQQVAVGGMLDSGEEEIDSNINRQQVTNEGTYIPEEDTTVRDKIRETMLDPSAQSRYVRS